MPAERRRELWLEPLPAAVLADRLADLPLFASVSVDELFRIASASKQVRHDPGTVLLSEGATPEMIHLLLDGDVVASGGHDGTADDQRSGAARVRRGARGRGGEPDDRRPRAWRSRWR